ncbi:enoyl-CoA hydratase/isomerase family protein [Faunimonas sp. B44]|uniref:enoyl-CoA hydratase/isomerase family protein n=1 Tax=Faunimonas sp. B44 TaxID=3461493 RepID=UPI004043D2F1
MIKTERADRIAIVTLDRPERRNALSSPMVRDLDRTLVALDRDPEVGAIVLTGAAPSFCAGSDLKELGRLDLAGMVDNEAETAAMARRIAFLNTPVIAAVEGHALGGGFILAVSCDLVVAAEDSRWGLPEVPNGWLPPWGLKALLSRVGPTSARRLVWGVETLNGTEAVRLGVADFAAPAGGALGRALEVATRLAALPAPAVRSTKQAFRFVAAGDAETWDAAASEAFAENCGHETAAATLSRFASKA